MAHLVLLGGPPGVGKNAVLPHIREKLDDCICMDADEVYGVPLNEFTDYMGDRWIYTVIEKTARALENANIVILTWVFARQDMVQQVVDGLEGWYETVHQLYLVATPEKIRERRASRNDYDEEMQNYSLGKLDLINALSFPKIDTTDLSIPEVADRVIRRLRRLV